MDVLTRLGGVNGDRQVTPAAPGRLEALADGLSSGRYVAVDTDRRWFDAMTVIAPDLAAAGQIGAVLVDVNAHDDQWWPVPGHIPGAVVAVELVHVDDVNDFTDLLDSRGLLGGHEQAGGQLLALNSGDGDIPQPPGLDRQPR